MYLETLQKADISPGCSLKRRRIPTVSVRY